MYTARGRGQRGGRGSGRGRGSSRGGPSHGGPLLPSSILEEVDKVYGVPKGRITGPRARKEQRMAARHPHRLDGRQQYPPRPSVQPPKERNVVERDVHRGDRAPQVPDRTSSTVPPHKSSMASGRPAKKARKELTLPNMDSADAEDNEIEWLEYMLKKEKAKAVEGDLSDGLDELLYMADQIGPGGAGLKRSRLPEGDDDEPHHGSQITTDSQGGESATEDSREDGEDVDGLKSSQSDEAESEDNSQSRQPRRRRPLTSTSPSKAHSHASGPDSDDQDPESDHFESDSDAIDGVAESVEHNVLADDADLEEELAGESHSSKQIGDAGVPAIGSPDAGKGPPRYMPPHLRAAQLQARADGDKRRAEEHMKLERKAQGLLNKLSEANIESILSDVEELYRANARNDVTTVLIALIMQTISSRSNLLESFVVLYALIAAAVHKVVGMEFGAQLVHTLITRYLNLNSNPEIRTQLPSTIYETPDTGKEGLNLLTLLAELYNVQVIGSGLIYDVVRSLMRGDVMANGMGEEDVERLLKIVRTCGQQLRHDDPASLKDIVSLVQERTSGNEKHMTARARFMVETLANLKNGKLKPVPGADVEATARMKKFLASLGRKRRLLATEPIRVSLTDLMSADKRGKWWLVGAGWSGDPLAELAVHERPTAMIKPGGKTADQALLEMARKQGMNTDIRRSVFMTLMTSEDYMHACDRLAALRFTEVQQREFVRVALHCCSSERAYNPYHTLVLSHLCANSHSHRFTLQYALWDFLRSLGEPDAGKTGKRRGPNVAKALAYIIALRHLDLTVLKAMDWTSLSAPSRSFITTFLLHLVLSTQSQSPLFHLSKAWKAADFDKQAIVEVFEKALVNPDLAHGLLYVLNRSFGDGGRAAVEKVGWGERESALVKRGLEVGKKVLVRAV